MNVTAQAHSTEDNTFVSGMSRVSATEEESQAANADAHGRMPQEERYVLADTGANELIRPAGEGQPPRSTKVSLTLADGNMTFAWRTRDGELAIPGEESSWIAPIGKIVELGYRFTFGSFKWCTA